MFKDFCSLSTISQLFFYFSSLTESITVSESSISLPTKNWSEQILGNQRPPYKFVYAETDFIEEVPVYIKSVAVNFVESTATKYILGVKCENDNYRKENPVNFNSMGDVSQIIKDFNGEQICSGISNPKYHTLANIEGGALSQGVLRSTK